MTRKEILKVAKPILFNTDMVRAILDGRKTVTRRLVKPQPKFRLCYTFAGCNHGTWSYPSDTAHEFWGEKYRLPDCITDEDREVVWKPPYHTDDVLYVRETWCKDVSRYMYRADYSDTEKFYRDGKEIKMKWHPSLHMPKEAARIFLKVKDVRVERLQEITEKQSEDEGCIDDVEYCVGATARAHFKELWNSTIKKSDLDRYGWDVNPWVWVIEFERIELE